MCEIIDNGKTRVLNNGTDVTIIASNYRATDAMKASRTLVVKGISTAVIEVLTLEPLDEDTLLSYGKKTGVMIFVDFKIYQMTKRCLGDQCILIHLVHDPSVPNIIKAATEMSKNKLEMNRDVISNYIHYVK